MLSTPAFNALLKTIDEPPELVVFIMAIPKAEGPERFFRAASSLSFAPSPPQGFLDRLRLIAKAEKIAVEDDALREIARSGEGSMRDAQSAFDQVISFAGTTI